MEHFGTVEVSGSAVLERLDPLAAVARLRRLGMARGSQAPLIAREPLDTWPQPQHRNMPRASYSWTACVGRNRQGAAEALQQRKAHGPRAASGTGPG
jgi:hypothetical protein